MFKNTSGRVLLTLGTSYYEGNALILRKTMTKTREKKLNWNRLKTQPRNGELHVFWMYTHTQL